MRFSRFRTNGRIGLAVWTDGLLRGLTEDMPNYPGDLPAFVGLGRDGLTGLAQVLGRGALWEPEEVEWLVPLPNPPKILCVGLNYHDHTRESGYAQPKAPTFFGRFASSLIAHQQPMIRPSVSDALDFEGELAVIIGRPGRAINPADALSHVLGYALFNDGTVRDWQHQTPQWTLGKNFDGTGAFGPALVTADEVPPGARGLRLETRLNGQVMQQASTDDLIFDIPALIAHASAAMTLQTGDVIVTGTPAGIGHAREPKVYMRPGDRIEVTVEGIGTLSNPVTDQKVQP